MEIKKRNPIVVILLAMVTFGIYGIYWYVKTKGEINSLGGKIPSAWLVIVPVANIYWLYKYCDEFAKNVKKDDKGLLYFVLNFVPFGGMILTFIVQNALNEMAGGEDSTPSEQSSDEA